MKMNEVEVAKEPFEESKKDEEVQKVKAAF